MDEEAPQPKSRSQRLADALQPQEEDADAAGVGGKSKIAKSAAKVKKTKAAVKAEASAEGGGILAAAEMSGGFKLPPPPPRPTAPRPKPGASPAPDKDKEAVLAAGIRRRIARRVELAQQYPERYGDITAPTIPEKCKVEQLKALEADLVSDMGAHSATNLFMSFMTGLPAQLEMLSMQGKIPLDLIGLEADLVPPESRPDEFAVSDSFVAILQELAIDYDGMFRVRPEFRLLAMLAKACVIRHNANASSYLTPDPAPPADN